MLGNGGLHLNRHKNKFFNVLMKIKTSNCSVADFDYELAVSMWKEKKTHRIYNNVSNLMYPTVSSY